MPARPAPGHGGQKGGMVNEAGSFPEFCKKSLQAMAADMQGAIKPEFWSTYSTAQLQSFSPRDLESCGRLTQPVVLERGSDYYRPISWEDAHQPDRRQAEEPSRRTRRSGISAAGARTKPVSCCNFSPGCMAPTTSTIAASIAIRPAASACQLRSAPARRRSRWKTSSMRTWSSSSAATRPAIIRG